MATYLVVQATGMQSQWTIEHLIAAGQKVHALVRNRDKPLHAILQHERVRIFKGENADFDAILEAAQGCKGAFLNTHPYPCPEVDQANAMIEACKKAGVQSIVSSSTFVTDKRDVWDTTEMENIGLRGYYRSKAGVEDIIRKSGLIYTILRPAFLSSNYFFPGLSYNYPELPTQGIIFHAFEPGTRTVHIDTGDVGRFAAAALLDPAKFGGEEIDLASNGYTIEESAEILSNVSGMKVVAKRREPEEIEALKPTLPGQKFQLRSKYHNVGIKEQDVLKMQEKYGIAFTSLEDALRRDMSYLRKSLPAQDVDASN